LLEVGLEAVKNRLMITVESVKNENEDCSNEDLYTALMNSNELSLKGYIFAMQANLVTKKPDWLDNLTKLLASREPVLFFVFVTFFLKKLYENDLKIDSKTTMDLLKMISAK